MASNVSYGLQRAAPSIRSGARVFGLAVVLASTAYASLTHAQSWSPGRTSPALWQVVSIDRTGEPGWPYGREDIAGDGLPTFQLDESSADLRSVYADAQADRLWLRAYVSSVSEPTVAVSAFFFLDRDARDATGGAAQGAELDANLGTDPTTGGYELAVGVAGDGSLLGAWQWDSAARSWLLLDKLKPQDVRTELGSALDPLKIGAENHGYLQADLLHSISGLTASCGGTIFVRTLHQEPAARSFADDAPEEFACQQADDVYGDPEILRSFACTSDEQCPADGRCRDGLCLFTYDCDDVADCPAGEACSAGKCVQVVNESCDESADCRGLVCQGMRCVACTETGARACADGLVCAPDGACLNPAGGGPGDTSSGPGKVQGGPFSCSARNGSNSSFSWLLVLGVFGLAAHLTRRRFAAKASSAHETRHS